MGFVFSITAGPWTRQCSEICLRVSVCFTCSGNPPPLWRSVHSPSQACVLSCRWAAVNTAVARSSGYIQRAPELALRSRGDLSTEGRGRLDATKVNHTSCVWYRKLDIPWFVKGSRPKKKKKTPSCSACVWLFWNTFSVVKTSSTNQDILKTRKWGTLYAGAVAPHTFYFLLTPLTQCSITQVRLWDDNRNAGSVSPNVFFFSFCETVKTYNWLRWGYLKKRSQIIKWF